MLLYVINVDGLLVPQNRQDGFTFTSVNQYWDVEQRSKTIIISTDLQSLSEILYYSRVGLIVVYKY